MVRPPRRGTGIRRAAGGRCPACGTPMSLAPEEGPARWCRTPSRPEENPTPEPAVRTTPVRPDRSPAT
ncbi:hypothetical protein FPZ41_32835 [Streptomyces sp. K1PN6]|uniref:Uncharacterized protein n=1 Tax=Streptomyces acidicola TaxID=2596892 RepID=A0A5N8X0E2_9ACTN|nr:hypothetical protein [Streptomyces acidicola]